MYKKRDKTAIIPKYIIITVLGDAVKNVENMRNVMTRNMELETLEVYTPSKSLVASTTLP